MKSLYEMDREYELCEAERKGIRQAIKEEYPKLINGLIGQLGYSKQEAIDFMTTYLHTTVAEAEQQYQEATKQK